MLACAAVLRGVKQHGIYRPTEDRSRMHLGLLSRLAELALTGTDAGRPCLGVVVLAAFNGAAACAPACIVFKLAGSLARPAGCHPGMLHLAETLSTCSP